MLTGKGVISLIAVSSGLKEAIYRQTGKKSKFFLYIPCGFNCYLSRRGTTIITREQKS
jgi:hypothetical protein